MKRILIVDDHVVVRQGLKQFIADIGDLSIAGEASSGAEALPLVQQQDWDLVLLDISLTDMSGLDLLQRLKRIKPELPVLVFSMHAEEAYAMMAITNGAAGYITKDSPADELLLAIRRVANGGNYVGPKLAHQLLTGATNKETPRQRHEALSKRELEVLLLLSRGLALTVIAERLHLSAKTVSTYRARILEKLDLYSNADIARYVMQHNLDPQRALQGL